MEIEKAFFERLKKNQLLINNYLEKFIKKIKINPDFKKVLAYALLSGGKRIRANLVFFTNDLALTLINKSEKNIKKNQNDILKIAAAIECIHTYSLVHDDLPAMDDDDLRRGRKTVHVKYDEATAILAGDALLNLGFEILADLTSPRAVQVIQQIAKASGAWGMVAGQHLDLKNENKKITQKELVELHNLKTGKMIIASIMAVVAYYDLTDYKSYFQKYGESIGLSFQVIDDILDVTQPTEILGKNAASDLKKNKSTFVNLLGLEKATREAHRLAANACLNLDKIVRTSGEENLKQKMPFRNLKNLAYYIIKRVS